MVNASVYLADGQCGNNLTSHTDDVRSNSPIEDITLFSRTGKELRRYAEFAEIVRIASCARAKSRRSARYDRSVRSVHHRKRRDFADAIPLRRSRWLNVRAAVFHRMHKHAPG